MSILLVPESMIITMALKSSKDGAVSLKHSTVGLDKHLSTDFPSEKKHLPSDVREKLTWHEVRTRILCRRVFCHFIKRFMSGFARGIGVYAGLKFILSLMRNTPNRGSMWQGIFSVDCVRVATFFGLYPSVYHLLVEVLRTVRKHKDGWTYGIAGGLAGLSVAILDKRRRQTLAFFTLARAMGAGLSTLVSRGHLPAVPFFEVGTFCACTSLILYCVTLKPTYMDQGYYRSVLKWSRDFTEANSDFLFRPLSTIKHLFENLIMSTSFLALMIFLAKLMLCVLRNLSHGPPPLPSSIALIAGGIAGLAILTERYNRRKELCLFVISQAINILYFATKHTKLLPYIRLPCFFTVIFALSMMCVMHAYEREPGSLTMLISGIIRYFVGSETMSLIISDRVSS